MPWEDLIAIRQEAKEIADEERRKPPIDCPQCGTPLQYNESQRMYGCPFDGYRIAGRSPGNS